MTDVRLSLACWSALMLCNAALALAGFRRTARLFVRGTTPAPIALARRIAGGVTAAARFAPGSSCLAQACAARLLLAMRGYALTMRIGVRDVDGELKAHAWLLCDGTVVLGGHVDHFPDYRRIADYG